ncbi:MAG2-interacting protein 2 isoform X2 [Diospyros lotus]|uniref:MAG2-interacting protein 2 isoform X2 n=1 Tax=Diospyros lotus TaxID=55363 RepID=UPI00224CC5C0|nr:MAG2-interacting protein 2 isoform X2 [Diospyros lotus]
MEEGVREVLYETRFHASRPYTPNYPPQQRRQENKGVKGSLLSLLSTRGVSQLKEKLSGIRRPKKLRRWISLFISPMGKHVAVAVGNQITILQKDDDYQEPCGIFTSSSTGTFTSGIWSESHDVLGLVDDTDILYFIKANGEEITRIKEQASLRIISLIVHNDSDTKKSCLCKFVVITSGGCLHEIEVSRDPSASILSARNGSRVKEFPENVFCLNYHPELSLLAVVGGAVSIPLASSGTCSLSLWQRNRNLEWKSLVSTQFESLFSKTKDFVGRLTYPKVSISPKGKFVAVLDLRGHLTIFNLDTEQSSLSKLYYGENYDSQEADELSTRDRESMNDILDFAWWSEYILVLAKSSGIVTMIHIHTGVKLLEKDPLYSMPILEHTQQFPGHLFLLETTSSEDNQNSSNRNGVSDQQHLDLVNEDNYSQVDVAKLQWRLLSFSNRSVSEMFNILLGNQNYQTALDFATSHGLDKDEVLKSQWLHSVQGVNEINMFLAVIKDRVFVLSECVVGVGPTEDAVRALIALGLHLTDQYRFSETGTNENTQIWNFRLARLKLLQFRDKLETFLGINMGRFSVQEYSKFRCMPINEAAAKLAESGKIGALNLLFKRHPFSLTPFMLEILAAIPETVPVQTYRQLLPGSSPPLSVTLREKDWVECQEMVAFINKLPESHETGIQLRTEPIMKQCVGFSWPSTDELSIWYKNRARDMDSLSGQLDNCLSLIDFACHKGIHELQQFLNDISYLHQLIYSDGSGNEASFHMSLITWEQLSDYEKFKMMLHGVKEENVVERLHEKAIPFMKNRLDIMMLNSRVVVMDDHSTTEKKVDSFLVRWLKEIASENKLDICLKVIEEGCLDFQNNSIFRNKAEAVDCALQCIYLCTNTDRWSTMTSILLKLPEMQDSEECVEELITRTKLAEGHIEAGRLLSVYQVPKPINFFLEAHCDGKGVKQILRLILSKFVRRQPSHSDNDWANMWHDLQSLREKAFPFLDQEYMLMEFCRGLLKAGKFSLTRNYLRGTTVVPLATEKAENLVIQAAREYFFSASSLSCSEIWKAKECLNLFPSSRNVRAEADIIDALTVKLPSLGVILLPVQFKQIKDPMEIIKLAITSQVGAYLNVDELIEIAKLLGLSSQDDISAVQEAIAREAAVAGDLQLAFDLCLVLVKKGHGSIWDLCAAVARGPDLENMDTSSRKQLLGFALSYCDEESIGELLHAWKDLDMQGQCETLMMFSGTEPPKFSVHSSPIVSSSRQVDGINFDDQQAYIKNTKTTLSVVAKELSNDNGSDWETVLEENGKILSFAILQLPWLLELCHKEEHGKKLIGGSVLINKYVSVRTQAVLTILSWLARNGFAPRDDLIASLAKSIMEPPVTDEEDIIGSSFLLNLMDAFHGVEIIEEQVRTRQAYNEVCSIMTVGMIYGLLHNSAVQCEGPNQRRTLLLRKFQEKHTPLSSDELENIDRAQSSFWRNWKLKLEEQKRIADHSRVLEQIIPGVETTRFLSGDINYIESVVFAFVESVKFEKKHILKDVLKLAHTYGLNRKKVLLAYLNSVLTSEVWPLDDITAEISEFRNEIFACAVEAIKIISSYVYPAIDGRDKQRLAFIYGLLSDCYLQLEVTNELVPALHPDPACATVGIAGFYKVIEQECSRVSFIESLNFKNIAGLDGLNSKYFSSEIYVHVVENSVEALATMVKNLISIYKDPMSEGLISWQDVYRHHVLCLLESLEARAKTQVEPESLNSIISGLEQIYDVSRKYIRVLAYQDTLGIIKRFFTVIVPLDKSFESLSSDTTWQGSLIFLSNFWLRVIDDMQELVNHEHPEEKCNVEGFMCCLKIFTRLVVEGRVSSNKAWKTLINYINYGLGGAFAVDIFLFCRAMIFSGCGFGAIEEVYSEAVSKFQNDSRSVANTDIHFERIQDLSHLYSSILETILQEFAAGSLEHQNLHQLISSLRTVDGNSENLNGVRHAVWGRMIEFSDNLMLPSHVRVYALELMQFITASDRNIKGFSAELQSNVLPWEGWDDLRRTNSETVANPDVAAQSDASSRLTNTLVALRSSQLVRAISPRIEISPEDLLTVDSAVSCFLRLCEVATSEPQIDALLAILREWEGLFTMTKDEQAGSDETADAANDWGNDDWDEGWESFQEEPVVANETKNDDSLSVHPLHACWLEIFEKLVAMSRVEDLLNLVDRSIVKSDGVLLDQQGASSLSQTLLGIDCFLALKVALSFPYEAIQLQCLDAVEDKLKQGGVSDTTSKDHVFLILVLSSGLISTIISGPSYGTTFSFLCYMVGNFSRQCQEARLSSSRRGGRNEHDNRATDFLNLFGRILFPCFVSELVKAEQQILAGFLVTKFMHNNAALSLINTAEASLRRYLERQLQVLRDDEPLGFGEPLANIIKGLRGGAENLVQSALSCLHSGPV